MENELELPRPERPERQRSQGFKPDEMKNRSRMLINEMVYHQSIGQQPTVVENRYGRTLETPEQPYARNLTIGPEWKKMDQGWLEGGVSMLVLSNEEGKYLQVNPTLEERKAITERVVEIAFQMTDEPMIEVRPGESTRFSPLNLGHVWVRCRCGKASCKLTLFPK